MKCIEPAVVPSVHLGPFLQSRNKLYGYADDSTVVAFVPSPGKTLSVTESMNRDLNRVCMWWDL